MSSSIHRGQFLQRGRGIGGIFSSLIRILKPIFKQSTGSIIKASKIALKEPDVNKALRKIKKTFLKSGRKLIQKKISISKKNEPKQTPKKKKVDIFS